MLKHILPSVGALTVLSAVAFGHPQQGPQGAADKPGDGANGRTAAAHAQAPVTPGQGVLPRPDRGPEASDTQGRAVVAQRPREAGGARTTSMQPEATRTRVIEVEGAEPPADTAGRRPGVERFIAAQHDGQMSADALLGSKVVNAAGDDVGEVKDLLFADDGRIAGAVVGVGGFLGIGEKDVAVRWDEVRVRPRADGGGGGDVELAVELTRQDLELAPAFKSLAEARAEEAVEEQERSLLKRKDTGRPIETRTDDGQAAPRGDAAR